MKEYLHPVNLRSKAYVLGILLTFGHAYNQYEVKNLNNSTNYQIERMYGSMLCAMLFPLYWSVKLFEEPK